MFRIILSLLCLTACSQPAPFNGYVNKGRAEAGGFAFNVFWSAERFEVVRTSLGRPRDASAFLNAIYVGVENTTGCRIEAVRPEPDRIIAKGDLTC